MVFYLLLFILILAVSFLLAYRSMKDYDKKNHFPEKVGSLYLIRNPKALDSQTIELIANKAALKRVSFSIERLYKGNKSALVIFGLPVLFEEIYQKLDLLELEDYVHTNQSITDSWSIKIPENKPKIDFELEHSDQLWWQLTIGTGKATKKSNLSSYDLMLQKTTKKIQGSQGLIAELRVVFLIDEQFRLQAIQQQLEKSLNDKNLIISKDITVASDYIVRALKYGSSVSAQTVVDLLF